MCLNALYSKVFIVGNLDFINELVSAFKSELIRYRVLATGIFAAILLSVIFVGSTWQTFFSSTAMLVVDDSNIIQPLLQGRAEIAEVDHSEEARQQVYARRLLEKVAMRMGYIDETSDGDAVGAAVGAIRAGILLEGKGRGSPYFTITYSHPDPDITFETANILIEEFIELHESSKRQEGEYAFDFINKQVELYRGRLEKAEAALKEFKTNSPDYTEDAVQARIQDLNLEIQELKLNIQESQSKISSTKAQLGAESELLTVQAEVYRLRQQKQELQSELATLRRQYQDSYPDIVSINQQIADIDFQIAEIDGGKIVDMSAFSGNEFNESNPELLFDELRKQISISEVELVAQKRRMDSLRKLLDEEYSKADVVTENQAELSDLTRDYQVTKDVYEEMLSRKENAELSMAITREGQGLTYKIVEAPVFPLSPSGLTFKEFLLVAPILAVGVPIGLIIMLILVDPRIRVVSSQMAFLEDYRLESITVSPHFHTNIGNRVLRKDFIILAGVFFVLLLIYGYYATIGFIDA